MKPIKVTSPKKQGQIIGMCCRVCKKELHPADTFKLTKYEGKNVLLCDKHSRITEVRGK